MTRIDTAAKWPLLGALKVAPGQLLGCCGGWSCTNLAQSVVGIAATVVMPVDAAATDLFVVPDATQISIDRSYTLEGLPDAFEMRKIGSTNGGFKRGLFRWDPATNSWILQGKLKQDDPYFGSVRLWKKYYADDGSLSSEALDITAGGADVETVEFAAPSGSVYTTLCNFEGTTFGIKLFGCGKELPPGQTEFGNGKYVVTFVLTSGARVSRNYFVGGGYPTQFNIKSPAASATNVPTAPTIKWTTVGAAHYDIIIRDDVGASVYGGEVSNSIDASLSHAVPAGVLQPNKSYSLTIEPNSPVVNGGSKGARKRVQFTTAP